MAAGEYISMRSQREAYQREITLEERELRDDPEAEAEELALIYRAKVGRRGSRAGRDDHHERPRGGARHDGARRARA